MVYSKEKLEKIEEYAERINTDHLPSDIRSEFTVYKKLFIDDARKNDGMLWNIAKSAGTTFVKTFTGGILGLGESLGEIGLDIYSGYKDSEKQKKSWSNILSMVNKYKISNAWYENLIQSLQAKYNKNKK